MVGSSPSAFTVPISRTATAASCRLRHLASASLSSPASSPMAATLAVSCTGPLTRHTSRSRSSVAARKPRAFEVLPRRWVVERTFAWIFKNRRLVRDYEQLTAVAETLIIIAASATLLRRWS